MNRYIFSESIEEQFHAGSKAREDVILILKKNGFQDFCISKKRNNIYVRYFAYILFPLEYCIKLIFLQSKSCIVFQLPLGYSKLDIVMILSIIIFSFIKKLKKITYICIIHDIEKKRNKKKSFFEKELFSIFDYFIAHNIVMQNILLNEYHISYKKTVILNLFDYLTEYKIPAFNISQGYNTVIFAGNLKKSEFIYKLNELQTDTRIILYGVGYTQQANMKNISYMGVVTPEKLPSHLNKYGFGLVWDGDSLETCSGVAGQYLQYNSSHKLSCYIVSGLPLIVWDKSAIVDYILSKNIGFAIGSLYELNMKITNISSEVYSKMRHNVAVEANRLTHGDNLMNCINTIPNACNQESILSGL
jgi:hypothetical protein